MQSPKQSPDTRQWPAALAAMELPAFRWLLWGNVAFFLAMQGQMLTRTVLAWQLTHREMSLAYINIAFAVPMFLVSLFAGAVCDRVERRRLIMIGQSLIILNEVFILGLLWLERLEFWHMLVAASVGGTVVPFIMPARTAIVFSVVGPGRLGNAMALSGSVMNLSRVVGPALLGFVVDIYTVKGAYLLSTLLYLCAFLCMFGVPRSRSRDSGRKALLADIAQGFRYIAGHRQLLVCLLFGLMPMMLAMPVQNLLVVFADEVWEVGERGLGILLATAGMGGVLGSLWIARRGENPRRVKIMVACAAGFGTCLLLFSQSPSFLPALVALLLANGFASACQTLNNTVIQLLVDDSVRGRMTSFMMMSFSLTPLGVLPLALLAEKASAPLAVAVASVLLMVIVAVFYFASGTLRQMDESVKKVIREPAEATPKDMPGA
jgi:MFS family permease